jgi:hypothetical protein
VKIAVSDVRASADAIEEVGRKQRRWEKREGEAELRMCVFWKVRIGGHRITMLIRSKVSGKSRGVGCGVGRGQNGHEKSVVKRWNRWKRDGLRERFVFLSSMGRIGDFLDCLDCANVGRGSLGSSGGGSVKKFYNIDIGGKVSFG